MKRILIISALAIGLFLLGLVASIFIQLAAIPAQVSLRPLTEHEQAELYLFEHTKSYREYRLLKQVAFCESSWNLHAYNPSTHDGGLFQINHVHIAEANAKGMDVWGSWKDNIDYALLLKNKNGLRDWSASKHCWNVALR